MDVKLVDNHKSLSNLSANAEVKQIRLRFYNFTRHVIVVTHLCTTTQSEKVIS
jgi:hypothetical protein